MKLFILWLGSSYLKLVPQYYVFFAQDLELASPLFSYAFAAKSEQNTKFS